jgi:hypothetical protein
MGVRRSHSRPLTTDHELSREELAIYKLLATTTVSQASGQCPRWRPQQKNPARRGYGVHPNYTHHSGLIKDIRLIYQP